MHLVATAQQTIDKPASDVATLLNDYRARPSFLPDKYHDYQVEVGGNGAGTVASWTLHVGTHQRKYRVSVTGPDAAALLVERDEFSSFTTRWTVHPGGSGTLVSLQSEWDQRSAGFPALFERIFAPRSLASLHRLTLQRLADQLSRA